MWSEATDSITLVSDRQQRHRQQRLAAHASFAVELRRRHLLAARPTASSRAARGGNCRSDNFIASESGDIYFFSPGAARRLARDPQPGEPLRLPRRASPVRHHPHHGVVLLRHRPKPISDEAAATRRSPDAGDPRRQLHGLRHRQPGDPVRQRRPSRDVHLRTRRRGRCVCVSCIPSGAPPNSDVRAARTASSCRTTAAPSSRPNDALVHGDTNNGRSTSTSTSTAGRS